MHPMDSIAHGILANKPDIEAKRLLEQALEICQAGFIWKLWLLLCVWGGWYQPCSSLRLKSLG